MPAPRTIATAAPAAAGAGTCSRASLGDTKYGAAGTRIGGQLSGPGALFAANAAQRRLGGCRRARQAGQHRIEFGVCADELLDQPVLERMKADRHQPDA